MGEVRPRRSGLRREVRPAAARRQHASGGRELAPRRPRGQRGTARAAGLRLTAARCGVGRRGAGVHRRGRAGRARRSPGALPNAAAPHARVEPRSFAIPTTHARRVRLPGAGQHGGAPRAQGSSGTVIARVALAPDRTPPRGYSAHPARPVAHHPRPLDVAPGVAPSGEARGLSAPRRGVARVTGEAIPPEPAAPVRRSTSPGAAASSQVDTPRSRPRHALSCSGTRRPAKLSPMCLLCLCVSNSKTHSIVLVL